MLALAVAPDGFTVADLAGKLRSLTGQDEHQSTVRQAAYDLRKPRGKQLVVKPGRTPRCQCPAKPRGLLPGDSPRASRSSPPSAPESAPGPDRVDRR